MHDIIYFSKNGKCPVADFLSKLSKKDQAKMLREIELLGEFGFSLGAPHVKKLKGAEDIWELRIKQGSNSYRVFYFTLSDMKFVLLNAFQKKGPRTPKAEINRAISYKKMYLQRSE